MREHEELTLDYLFDLSSACTIFLHFPLTPPFPIIALLFIYALSQEQPPQITCLAPQYIANGVYATEACRAIPDLLPDIVVRHATGNPPQISSVN